MITCKRATELISKSMEESLSLVERAELKLHLFLCECCEQFRKQVELLRGVLRKEGEQGALSQSAKDRMHQAVDKAKEE